jgi:hypothetical protein
MLRWLKRKSLEIKAMIVNEDVALERIESPNNLCNKLFEIRKLHKSTEHEPIIKAIAALDHLNGTPCKEVEAEFGIPKTSVNDIKNGKHSFDPLKKHRHDAHEKALETMLESMDLIRPKLSNISKATDLSKIAADMARVVEKTTPKEAAQNNLKVVVFAPRMKDENEFEELAVNS